MRRDAPGVRAGSRGRGWGAIVALLVGCSSPDVITTECTWWGYGTPCGAACSSPAGFEFRVEQHWSNNGYCCSPEQVWEHCVCVNRRALCPQYPGDPNPVVPWSTCEFCASRDDAAVYDADQAATDAGDASDAP